MSDSMSTAPTIIPALLKPKDAGRYLSLSVQALRRLPIEPIQVPGRGKGSRPRLLYRRVDLDAWIEQQRNPRSRRGVMRRARTAAA